jgi:hypothetical protein
MLSIYFSYAMQKVMTLVMGIDYVVPRCAHEGGGAFYGFIAPPSVDTFYGLAME